MLTEPDHVLLHPGGYQCEEFHKKEQIPLLIIYQAAEAKRMRQLKPIPILSMEYAQQLVDRTPFAEWILIIAMQCDNGDPNDPEMHIPGDGEAVVAESSSRYLVSCK